MTYARPSKRSWWGGLYKRLLARGLDPATAKIVANHIRRDFKPYAERFIQLAEFDGSDDKLFRDLFIGV